MPETGLAPSNLRVKQVSRSLSQELWEGNESDESLYAYETQINQFANTSTHELA